MSKHFDVIIVGSGLAGQSAALVMARANINLCLVESGQGLNNNGYNFITRDGVKKHDLIELGNADLRPFDNVELHQAKVVGAEKIDDKFVVEYDDGRKFTSDYLVLANGIEFRSPLFELPGGREIFGKSMFTCPYCHGYEVNNKRVAMIGSGELTPDNFAVLTLWTDKFTCFSNGKPLEVTSETKEFLLKLDPENEIYEAPIVGFVHDEGMVSAIELADGSSVPVDAIFLSELQANRNQLAEQLGTKKEEIEESGDVVYPVDRLGRTTVKNLLLIGDSKNTFSTLIGAAYEGFNAGHFLIDIIANARFHERFEFEEELA